MSNQVFAKNPIAPTIANRNSTESEFSFSPHTRRAAREIYTKHKDLIEADAKHGTEWDRRVARTIKIVAGI